jgi:uncharacterized protein (TIGR00255 family)
MEEQLRRKLKEYTTRGRVDLYLSFDREEGSTESLQIDWSLIEQYFTAVNEINERFNLKGNFSATELLRFPNTVNLGYNRMEPENIGEQLIAIVDSACQQLLQMRLAEGESLYNDLQEKLAESIAFLLQVEERAPLVVADYQERLSQRIKELTNGQAELDDTRILTEVALFADKASIDEEISRLKSHYQQFAQILEEREPVGRKLDFLIQEMNREVNTIGSKANDKLLSQLVVELKSVLEKIREQVQNIE